MEKNIVGIQPLQMCNLGLGCMGMSECYGKTNELESVQTIYHNQLLPPNFAKENVFARSFTRVFE